MARNGKLKESYLRCARLQNIGVCGQGRTSFLKFVVFNQKCGSDNHYHFENGSDCRIKATIFFLSGSDSHRHFESGSDCRMKVYKFGLKSGSDSYYHF